MLFLIAVISLAAFFLILSSSPCIDFAMLASPVSPFLNTYSLSYLYDVRPNASSLAILFPGQSAEVLPSSISRMVPGIFQGEQVRCLSFWWDTNCRAWFWEDFLFVGDTLFLLFFFLSFFFYLRLFDGVRFQYSQALIVIIIIIIIIIINSILFILRFWQTVSPDLFDSSKYSGRLQPYWDLDALYSISDLLYTNCFPCFRLMIPRLQLWLESLLYFLLMF